MGVKTFEAETRRLASQRTASGTFRNVLHFNVPSLDSCSLRERDDTDECIMIRSVRSKQHRGWIH